MKIVFDTTSGVDTRSWECLITATCIPGDESIDDLFSGGWLFDPISTRWYMARSVRIDLAKWEAGKSATKAVEHYAWSRIDSPNAEDEELLQAYRKERDIMDYRYDTFEKIGEVYFERGEASSGNCWYMTTHSNTISVYFGPAFTKDGTKTSPGKACLTRACHVSKERGSSHLYVYEGYGSTNSYKVDYSGFEWWNGSSWTEDRNMYLKCLREDFKDMTGVLDVRVDT